MILRRRLLFFLAIFVVVLLGAASWWVQGRIRSRIQARTEKTLSSVLAATNHGFHTWVGEQKSAALVWAGTPEVRRFTEALLLLQNSPDSLKKSPAQAGLRSWFKPIGRVRGYQGFLVIAPGNINLASASDTNVGEISLLAEQEDFLLRTILGGTALSLPQPSDIPLPDSKGNLVAGLPTMFVGAPIKNERGDVIAALAFRIDPLADFAEIFMRGRIGTTSEAYAFDEKGRLITESRFDSQLRLAGIIPSGVSSIFNVEVSDPGVNLIEGETGATPLKKRPLTRMAKSAVVGGTSVSLEPYRDYRGVPVVGAWLWDEDHRIGIAAEEDASEAYSVLYFSQNIILASTGALILLFVGLVGVFSKFLTVYSDAEKRQVAERILRESEFRFRSVFESAMDAFITIDEQGCIGLFNSASERMFGYTESEVSGKNVNMLMPSPYCEEHDSYLQRYFRTGEKRVIGLIRTLEGLRKNGEKFPMELSVGENFIEGKRYISGVIRDITERFEIDQMKSEFISVVSHEIRTPLTSLRGSLGLLQGGVAGDINPEGAQLLDIAVNNSERLIRLINDILDLEKIESGTMELRMARVSVGEIVTRSLEEMQGLASENGVTIEQDVEAADVMADGDTIVQVLTNLLSNAIKFSDVGKTVLVTARKEGGRVKVSVKDHGRGIPSDMVGSIFDKFKQVDSSDSREKGGTGLGLAISRAIVEQHDGKIWAESEIGMGSVFCFTLQGPEIKEAVSPVLGVDGGKPRPPVLICDDDPAFVRYVRTIIEHEEYTAATASSAEEALEYLEKNEVSLLLLDIHLPGMSGLEFERRLRTAPVTADLPIIIVSVEEPFEELGVAGPVIIDWFTKPIDVGKFLDSLGSYLGQGKTPDILVVDDDEELLAVLSHQIGNLGALVRSARSGRQAVQMFREKMPALIILDIVMDDGDGFYVIDVLREEIEKSEVPIIVFSAEEMTGEQRRRASVGSTLFLTKSKTTNVQLEERVADLLNGLLSSPS